MRIVEHPGGGPDKLIRVETQGCAVHIAIGLHDPDGRLYTSVEVEPLEPDDDGHVWEVRGSATIVVVDHGPQTLAGDRTASAGNDHS